MMMIGKRPYFLPKSCTVKPFGEQSGDLPDGAIADQTKLADEPRWSRKSTLIYGVSMLVGLATYQPIDQDSLMGSQRILKAAPRFELGGEGFADPCLTTWLCRLIAVFGQRFDQR
jgi:hypothetical protein